MALGNKESGQIHNKTGADLAAMKAKYDAGTHLPYIGFDEIDMILYQMQLMSNDIDELRRFAADATEIRTVVSPLPTTNGGTGLAGGNDFYPIRYARVTLNTAAMNDLDHEGQTQTGEVLVAAPGANLWINPIDLRVDIDWAANQTNTRADLNICWDLGGKLPSIGTNVLFWARRFGNNTSGDTQWGFRKMDGKQVHDGDLVSSRINKALVAVGTGNQPFTPNCFTSCTFHVAYQILPA